jgi:hypothetical protein
MRKARAASLIAVWAMLAVPATAGAQAVPPGNSEADQYSETAPNDRGNAPIDRAGGSEEVTAGDAGGAFLSPEELRELAAQGADGRAAAELAAGGAPEGPASREPGGEVGGVSNAGGTDEQGLGLLLPLILAGVTVASLALALSRRRATPAG